MDTKSDMQGRQGPFENDTHSITGPGPQHFLDSVPASIKEMIKNHDEISVSLEDLVKHVDAAHNAYTEFHDKYFNESEPGFKENTGPAFADIGNPTVAHIKLAKVQHEKLIEAVLNLQSTHGALCGHMKHMASLVFPAHI